MTNNNNNNNKKTPNDFVVHGLEEVEPSYGHFDGTMYAGTIDIAHSVPERTLEYGHMMFWLFAPTVQKVDKTITVWLNGGPGCSSFNCGVMMEHSPVTQPLHNAGYCCLQATPDLFVNHHAWTKSTTMLYIEQPIGTGFSYGSPLPEDETDVSSDIYVFLTRFYDIFETYQDYDLYIFGESYAGMFVPSIARYIVQQNRKQKNQIRLGGAGIGNGWVNPKVQGPATIDYSWWHGLIDKPTRDALHHEFENCLEGHPGQLPFHPFNVQDDCGIMWGILQAAGNPNAYDVTTWDPNVDQVTFTSEGFYNSDPVKTALHAPTNITWHGCRWGEGRRRLQETQQRRQLLYMENDRPLNVVPYVGELLDSGVRVLVYNGDRDMTTNMVGTELCLNEMEWNHSDTWLDAPRGVWMVGPDNGDQAGWAKEHHGLTYVVVYNSGHMVPYNQPVPALDLLERFMRNETFIDQVAPTLRIPALVPSTRHVERHTSHSQQFGAFHMVGVGLISMVMGVLLTLGTMRSKRRGEYNRIPNAEAP